MCLKGNAQKLLSECTRLDLEDYQRLKNVLGRRFNPIEREVAFRCEFKTRKREKHETAAEFGYALRRLALKAYPQVTFSALESQIVDHFIHGLGHYELKKHVQFRHPITLDHAIAYAMEYEAFDGSLSQVRKPSAEIECVTEQGMSPMHAHVYQARDSRLTIQQEEHLVDRKLEKFKMEIKEMIS